MQAVLEKTVLPLFFFSPFITVSVIYGVTSGAHVHVLGATGQPLFFTLLLFWIWQNSSQRLLDERKNNSKVQHTAL